MFFIFNYILKYSLNGLDIHLFSIARRQSNSGGRRTTDNDDDDVPLSPRKTKRGILQFVYFFLQLLKHEMLL